MRRFARHLFTLCSALSLVLCVGTCALWVRSYGFNDAFMYTHKGPPGPEVTDRTFQGNRPGWWCGLSSLNGRMNLGWELNTPADPGTGWSSNRLSDGQFPHLKDLDLAAARRYHFAGFGADAHRRSFRYAGWLELTVTRSVVWPHWAAVAGTAVLPLAFLRRWRRARFRLKHGLCPACGYDLRASPERCPECGAARAG